MLEREFPVDTREFIFPCSPDNLEQLDAALREGMWHFLLFPEKFSGALAKLPREYIERGGDYEYVEVKNDPGRDWRAETTYVIRAGNIESAVYAMCFLMSMHSEPVEFFIVLPPEYPRMLTYISDEDVTP